MTTNAIIPTITLDEWKGAGMSYYQYEYEKRMGRLTTLNKPGKDSVVQIDFSSIKKRRYVDAIIKFLGFDPRKKGTGNLVADAMRADAKALEFFTSYEIEEDRYLLPENVKEYCANAEVLNAITEVVNSMTSHRRSRNISTKGMWKVITDNVDDIKCTNSLVTLPSSQIRLKEKHANYLKNGYSSLIHRGFRNTNRLKVAAHMERLLLSIAGMPNKPYNNTIRDIYLQFVGGAVDVVDFETGEMFLREDFFDKDGNPITISDSTVWNYVNDPKNLAILDRVRMGQHRYNGKHRPHVHRNTNIAYSLSKISMDDRDLEKMANGIRVKAYYAFDVKSRALIGYAHSKSKDRSLFVECMRNMFRLLHKNGMGMPLEVEVENHLVNQFKDTLMVAGEVFKYVRWCNAGNSQEKYAEIMNRQLKYQVAKKDRHVGRPFSRKETTNTMDSFKKEWNEEGMKLVERTYSYDEIVAIDLADIAKWNNMLHEDQVTYKGMTHMEVFLANANPASAKYDEVVLAKYIGDFTDTTIKRSQYVRVMYNDYQLPNPNVLSRLLPNNYKVEAYWIPSEDGSIGHVYLYQDGEFICKATKIEKFSTAKAEWTDRDEEIYKEQTDYIVSFDRMTKGGKKNLAKVSILNRNCDNKEPELADHQLPTDKTSAFPDISEIADKFYDELAASDEDLQHIRNKALNDL